MMNLAIEGRDCIFLSIYITWSLNLRRRVFIKPGRITAIVLFMNEKCRNCSFCLVIVIFFFLHAFGLIQASTLEVFMQGMFCALYV